MTKVQIPVPSGAFLLGIASLLGVSLAIGGCQNGETPSETTRDSGRFGDAYEVLTNEHPDAPDEPPAIVSDSLYVLVSYAGGCEDHDFDLESDTARDTTRLWLHHDNGGDTCEALIQERLAFDLSDDALENPTILFLNPNYEAPFVLR